jgi:hypothetical protein
VDFGTPGGGGGFVLVSQGSVTVHTFLEIEEKGVSPFSPLPFVDREVTENEEG